MNKLFFTLIIILLAFVMIPVSQVRADSNYTSVIIDCSEKGLQRAMSPVIRDISGKDVYPTEEMVSGMKSNEIFNSGVVIYEKSLETAKRNKLAGNNPLIIIATSVKGLLKSDPVITRLDAIKISLADYEGKFLNKKKVILVY